MTPERREYLRKYMRKRRAAERAGKPATASKPRGWRFPDGASYRQRAAEKGIYAQATLAAAAFHQPTLIDLPPHLQALFEAELAKVKAARGTHWAQAGAGNAGRVG